MKLHHFSKVESRDWCAVTINVLGNDGSLKLQILELERRVMKRSEHRDGQTKLKQGMIPRIKRCQSSSSLFPCNARDLVHSAAVFRCGVHSAKALSAKTSLICNRTNERTVNKILQQRRWLRFAPHRHVWRSELRHTVRSYLLRMLNGQLLNQMYALGCEIGIICWVIPRRIPWIPSAPSDSVDFSTPIMQEYSVQSTGTASESAKAHDVLLRLYDAVGSPDWPHAVVSVLRERGSVRPRPTRVCPHRPVTLQQNTAQQPSRLGDRLSGRLSIRQATSLVLVIGERKDRVPGPHAAILAAPTCLCCSLKHRNHDRTLHKIWLRPSKNTSPVGANDVLGDPSQSPITAAEPSSRGAYGLASEQPS